MKILQIVSSLDEKNGGVASGIVNTINARSQSINKHDVISGDDNAIHFLRENSTHFALGSMKTSWGYIPDFEHKLKELVARYDIVIINGLWQYPSYCTMKVIRELRRRGIQTPKVYIMPHGMLDPWFQRASSRRWKALRNEVYWALVERQVVNEADGLLFTCQQELELARITFWGYRPKQEINVGYGILPPPACTEAISCAFRHPRPYFLFLSRIHEKKGVDILINAYQNLCKENPIGAIPDLVIAGPGLESVYGQKVQSLVQDAYKENITFVGMLSGDRKWGALYGCEAFILPSHQENFGIAVVEALACGKPVLISDQVNIWKDLENTEGVYICQVDDSSVMKELIRILDVIIQKNGDLNIAMRNLYIEKFSIETFVDKLFLFLNGKESKIREHTNK